MGVLTALLLSSGLLAPPPPSGDALEIRVRVAPRERNWGQILGGFGLGVMAGPSFPLPLGTATPGARFGIRTDFRLATLGPAELGLVLPLAVRNRQEGDTTLGGFELFPGVSAAVRPWPFLRLSLEGSFGMLLLTLHDGDGIHDKTGIGVRAALPIEVRLTPTVWLGLVPAVLRDFSAQQGYGELSLGLTSRW